jgi:hypothetical protein
MADDGLSPWRQDRDRNLAEIKGLEASLARMKAAGSPAVESTQLLIDVLKKRVAEVESFLLERGNDNAERS